MTLTEGNLTFDFPCSVERYDQWSFFRNQFQNVCGGAKAVDFIVHSCGGAQMWLVEVKDYRQRRREKSSDLWLEFAEKVRDTLAGVYVASFNANEEREKESAWLLTCYEYLKCQAGTPQIRTVLHLEQPVKHSKLFPRAFDPSNLRTKIRQLLRVIDPHALVVDKNNLRGVPWTVR